MITSHFCPGSPGCRDRRKVEHAELAAHSSGSLDVQSRRAKALLGDVGREEQGAGIGLRDRKEIDRAVTIAHSRLRRRATPEEIGIEIAPGARLSVGRHQQLVTPLLQAQPYLRPSQLSRRQACVR